ncbi:hypothetical protein D3C84_1014810 [compost metagenome]
MGLDSARPDKIVITPPPCHIERSRDAFITFISSNPNHKHNYRNIPTLSHRAESRCFYYTHPRQIIIINTTIVTSLLCHIERSRDALITSYHPNPIVIINTTILAIHFVTSSVSFRAESRNEMLFNL